MEYFIAGGASPVGGAPSAQDQMFSWLPLASRGVPPYVSALA
jgi:hypothetical protein